MSSDRPDPDPAIPVLRRIERPRFRDLVFTSAGAHASVHRWLSGNPRFDTWITDYGGCSPALLEQAQYVAFRQGSKFQNLHDAYLSAPDVLAGYDAVFVADDDIEIDSEGINRLFEIRREFDLVVLQPAYHPAGKIAHPITRARPTSRLRFTNFVEVACPLFRRDRLVDYLSHYDPSLVGYGIDWWFCEVLGEGRPDRLAIVDEVECLNPLDTQKGGRQIDRLQGRAERRATWEAVRRERGLVGERQGTRTYRTVAFPIRIGRLARGVWYYLLFERGRLGARARRLGRRLKREWNRVNRLVFRGEAGDGIA